MGARMEEKRGNRFLRDKERPIKGGPSLVGEGGLSVSPRREKKLRIVSVGV